MNLSKSLVDVAIVGAGPAGMAAAITLARAGKKVVVVERGDFAGSKNVFGGVIYAEHAAEIYPEFWKEAPIERIITEHRYAILGQDDGTVVSYKNNKSLENEKLNAVSVIRAKWDRWCAKQAESCGACVVTQTIVRDLINDNGKFVGIRTDNEDFYAPIIIIADGVNSLLAQKAGLRPDLNPADVALAVKQTIIIPKQIIEDRFNLEENSGVGYTIFGGPMLGELGLGFIYTNKESVSIGVGISLNALESDSRKPYEILNQLCNHPSISPLIRDGKLSEYSAHLIPEGGYKKIPQLYTDGIMVVGDAAMLVNNVHFEGTNLAMMSGKFAAETAIEAINSGDFSAKALSVYEKKLRNSFVMKDLNSYKDIMHFVDKNSDAFLNFYPLKVNEFFRNFITVDGIPKSCKYRKFILDTIKQRGLGRIVVDIVKIVKQVFGVLLK